MRGRRGRPSLSRGRQPIDTSIPGIEGPIPTSAGGCHVVAPTVAESSLRHPTTPGFRCRMPLPRRPKRADKAFRYGGPGYCGVCDTRIYSALDAHMIACHLELGQLWRCPVTWCAVWKGSGRACLEHLAERHGGSTLEIKINVAQFFPHGR